MGHSGPKMSQHVHCVTGPVWLPIVGSAPYLKRLCRENRYLHLAVAHMSAEYKSPVIGLKLGNERTIVALTHQVVQQVHTREEFEGRPYNFFIKLRSMGGRRGETYRQSYSHNSPVGILTRLRVGRVKNQTLMPSTC
jgi:hypothetical protein